MTISQEEAQVWRYIVQTNDFDPLSISAACGVDYQLAEDCVNRIGTPLNVFKEDTTLREEVKEDSLNRPRKISVEPTRVRMLNRAKELTGGDRNRAYGPPFDNLTDCANLWNAYINSKWSVIATTQDGWEIKLKAEDVAWLMTMTKMARSFQTGYHDDNYVDAAAYSAIAGECREIQIEEDGQ